MKTKQLLKVFLAGFLMTLFGVQASHAQWAKCPSELTFAVDEEKTVTVEFEEGYTDTSVSWTYLGSTSVVSRTDEGTDKSASVTIKGVGIGTTALVCKVSAKKDSKLYSQAFTCEITVTAPELTKIELPETKKLAQGSTLVLETEVKVTPSNASKQGFKWESSDKAIATVTSSGIVRGISLGEATIKVTTPNEQSATCKVTVVAPDPVALSLPMTAEVKEGKTTTLEYTFGPSDASTANLEWESSNEAIATVADGVVTGKKAGKATITLKVKDSEEVSATCEVTVLPADATNIELPATAKVAQGGKLTLNFTKVEPTGASVENVKWTSDKEAIATVSEEGVVKGVKAGTAKITATTADGQTTASCTVTVLPPAPTFISLPASIDLAKGEKQILKLTKVLPEGASADNLEWTTSDDAVATVGATTGEVEAKAIGKAIITVKVKDTDVSAECEVNVVAPEPTDVTLAPTSIELAIGETQTLTATPTPDDASTAGLVWESNNTAVAIVNQSGKVTAIKAGKATITVKLKNDESKSSTCEVTVKAADPSAITLSETSIELAINDTETLKATVFPADASTENLEWTSSNTEVASVDNAGVVTGLKAGTATITVKVKNTDISATCEVKVKEATPTAVSLDKEKEEVTVGSTVTLTATFEGATPATDKIEWTSADEKIATVADGVVTGVKAGSTLISVKVKDSGLSASCLVTVKPVVPTSITFNPTEVEMVKGAEMKLTYTVDPTNASTEGLTWTSSANVAIVSEAGVVTAISAGTATIKVKNGDTELGTCQVKVLAPAAKAIALVETAEVKMNETLELKATVTPSDASATLEWTSDDTNVATVDQSTGVVTGKKPGTAKITVTIKDDTTISATCEVTVLPCDPTSVTITTEGNVTEVNAGNTLQLTLKFDPEGANAENLTWTSNDEKVATVSETGLVRGVKKGTAKITVTVKVNKETELTANFDVTVLAPDPIAVTLPATATVAKDGTLTLTPTLTPSDATTTFEWSSNNEAVATVDQTTGVVTGVAKGEATITATAANGKTASCKVTVTEASEPTKIELPATQEVAVGSTVTLNPTLIPTDASTAGLVWSSDDKTVAAVNSKGEVTGLKEGTATITVKFSETVFDECVVTVKAAEPVVPTSITLTSEGNVTEVKVGGKLTLISTVEPDNASLEGLTWTSSNDKVATVAASVVLGDGIVTGVKAGTATITVKTKNGLSATFDVTVLPSDLASIGLPATAEVVKGETLTLTPAVWPADAQTGKLTWTSNDNTIATVSATGVVTGVAVGTATITVKAENGLSASCNVTVLASNPTGIKLYYYNKETKTSAEIEKLEMTIGETKSIFAQLTPGDASYDLVWTSTYETVATVSKTGRKTADVKAVEAGKAIIIVHTPNGLSAQCEVTVRAEDAVYAQEVKVQTGKKEFRLPISLKNNEVVAGVGFTVNLPAGMTLKTDADGDLDYQLNIGRLAWGKFDIYSAFNADGSCSIRIMPKTSDVTISGTDGVLMTLPVKVADGAKSGTIKLTSNTLTVKDDKGNLYTLELNDTDINVIIDAAVDPSTTPMLGDVNGDGVVDLTDAVMILYASLGVDQENYNKDAADVNEDGIVDVSDAIFVVNMSLDADKQSSSRRKASSTSENDGLAIDDVVMSKGGTVELPVRFTNNMDEKIVGMQMRLILPEGVSTFKDDEELPIVALDATSCPKMSLFTTSNDGFGMLPMTQNASVKGSEGTLFTMTLLADDALEAGSVLEAIATDAKFTVKDENGTYTIPVSDFTFSIRIDGDDADAIVNIAQVQEDGSARYSLSGQRVSNSYKGIVVTNGRKVLVK